MNYVKNVVSAYSQRLNEIIAKYPNEFQRASFGRVEYNFTPNLNKTFNRGYTHYFVNGRQQGIFSPNTPKALGEYVGKVKEIRHNSFNVSSTASFLMAMVCVLLSVSLMASQKYRNIRRISCK